MFGVHSLAPAKLYAGSVWKPAPKPKPVMNDANREISVNGHATNPGDNDIAHVKKLAGTDTTTEPIQLDEQPSHGPRDSGVGSTIESHKSSSIEHETVPPSHDIEPDSRLAAPDLEPQGQQPASQDTQEPALRSPLQDVEGSENRTDSTDFTKSPTPAEAGPSQLRAKSSHSSLQHDSPLPTAAVSPRPDETHFNAIAYRRDPETVIAYLVPLPAPTVRGITMATEPRYFLYAPPPPPLLKPRYGGSEGYVRKLNRHWQQHVRRAQPPHPSYSDRRVSAPERIHSAIVRGTTWALGKLQGDDKTFLARIHPTTVTHLILIHPSGLAGAQTPEEVMHTFRSQMFASKARAKRDSILSAVFFLPALVVDTAAIFFGGMAEVDGIWMLVSVTAYRTARFITRKMGPEPKTMEIEQAQLIEDAKRNGFPPPVPEGEEDSEPGAVRKSMDALRRSLGSVKYRISMTQRRNGSKKRKNGESSSADTSQPQTNDASRTDLEGFSGAELEHHVEEENEAPADAAVEATTATSTERSGLELSGFLDHMEEEITENERPESTRGVLADNSEGHRASAETSNSSKSKKKGQNFQLTFYPSPAMEVLARYLQQSCHTKNDRAYQSPTPVPTEEDVLAVLGWHPETREHDTPEGEADDEEWQTRQIKQDLRQASSKAAKAWNKSCRRQAKQQQRRGRSGLLKRKTSEPNASDDEPPPAEKKAPSAAVKARMAAVGSKMQRKSAPWPATDAETPSASATPTQTNAKGAKRGRAVRAAALLLGMPCFATAEGPAEKGSARPGALKRRLSSKRVALRRRKKTTERSAADAQGPLPTAAPVGFETSTDIDESPTDTEGQTTAVATDVEDQTDVEDYAAQPKDRSTKDRLFPIPAALATGIGAASKERRDGRDYMATPAAEAQAKKPSRFSAQQERFKARRTRVTRKQPARTTEGRTSGWRDWFKELNQKREAKSAAKTKEVKATDEDKTKSSNKRSAVVGLLTGCVALPIAKTKQMRDKRRKTEPTIDAPAIVTGTPLSPVLEEQQPPTTTSDSTTLATSTANADRPNMSHQPPVVEEEYEDAPEELPPAGQYLPGCGQSEVPVRPGAADERPLGQ